MEEQKSAFQKFLRTKILFVATILCSFCLWASPALATETSSVIPGGQSIGVLLHTEGVTIVGFSPIADENGELLEPASDAGLKIGDFITSINDTVISCNEDMEEVVAAAGEAGETCSIEYNRNGLTASVEVEPVLDEEEQSWRLGLYVRDNVAGVGTLTFYDPETGFYAALGHEVSLNQENEETNTLGQIIRAAVQGIRPSEAGEPGEKMGVFLDQEWSGTISQNGKFGIYGNIPSLPNSGCIQETMEIADPAEVTLGPAQICTVLDGETVECFDVEIVKLLPDHRSNGRGMIIEVTDQTLLERCGGIVQGMSGSPIIQNNKLVGAVSHVFVSDPVRGYGCFAAWMLEEGQSSLSD